MCQRSCAIFIVMIVEIVRKLFICIFKRGLGAFLCLCIYFSLLGVWHTCLSIECCELIIGRCEIVAFPFTMKLSSPLCAFHCRIVSLN